MLYNISSCCYCSNSCNDAHSNLDRSGTWKPFYSGCATIDVFVCMCTDIYTIYLNWLGKALIIDLCGHMEILSLLMSRMPPD